jgi:hypothetical protein
MNIWEFWEKEQFLARIWSALQQEIGRAPAGARSKFSPEISLSLKNPKYSIMSAGADLPNWRVGDLSQMKLQFTTRA